MSAADEITYVDAAPAIPGHLGTDAPHVHARQSDECLRAPEGERCLSGAELRAEVEALRRDREGLQRGLRVAARNRMAATERAEFAEAERDALQQQVANADRFARSRATAAWALGRHDEERTWLDLLILLDPLAPSTEGDRS